LTDGDDWKRGEGKERCLEITDNEDFVAVLEKFPRIEGEILIISKKCGEEAYDDSSEISKFGEDERDNFCRIIGDTTELIKRNLHAEKVYLYSFCEHWEEEEVQYVDKLTSEHLHIHLLPRYRGMRHRELAAEKIFSIPSKELSSSMLHAVKYELLGRKPNKT
jgi:diadenosine tetraphosphate (Ap4A) HIT family hydrolase